MRMGKRIKTLFLSACLLASGGIVYAVAMLPGPDMVEYRVTVQPRDTIWGVCSRVVSDRDDLARVVWETRRRAGITDAAELQPGTELRVRVVSVADRAMREEQK